MLKIGQEPLSFRRDPLPHYFFPMLDVKHAVLTRGGGVSEGPYASLNLSYEVGDHPERVSENRKRLKQAFGLKVLVSAKQVHGQGVLVVEGVSEDLEVQGYDALITSTPGLGLLIKQADCQAIILYAPGKQILGLVHAGWRGLVRGVIEETVRVLKREFGLSPREVWAGISPSLQPCCAEFKDWQRLFPSWFSRYELRPNHFDLPAISTEILKNCGLSPAKIKVSRLCTKCREEFFSYRREKKSGRFGTLAWL